MGCFFCLTYLLGRAYIHCLGWIFFRVAFVLMVVIIFY